MAKPTTTKNTTQESKDPSKKEKPRTVVPKKTGKETNTNTTTARVSHEKETPARVSHEKETPEKKSPPKVVQSKKLKNDPNTVSTKKVMNFVQDFLTKQNCVDKIEEWNKTQDSLNGLMQNILKDNKTKTKKLKDPNAPKRPLTAYMFFCEANRKKMQEKYPDKKVTEISVVLADAWKKIKDKKPFEKQAEDAKALYLEKMKTFVPTQGYEKTFKKVKDPNAPKRPLSAYMLFCMDRRKEGFPPDVKGKDIMAKLGSMWKELSESQKTLYANKSKELKDAYTNQKSVKV